MLNDNTIIAISTPTGIGAISIVRLSGDKALEIVDVFFKNKSKKKLINQKTNTSHYGQIVDKGILIDEVVVTIYKNPNSFTGEDTVEISCHGSKYIQQKILHLFIKNGVAPAKPGEFSLRSFLNGKRDLIQAEAIADLISSESEASHSLAIKQMKGGFSIEIKKLRKKLLDFASLIELELDFSEEDIEFADRNQFKLLLNKIEKTISKLTDSFSLGNVLKNGIPIAIIGPPNSGKSTLLNTLLNEDKAIVSEIAGTTRDIIEDQINLNGINFRFIDTAGLRKTKNKIEKIGIKKTYDKLKNASYILYMIDSQSYIKKKSNIKLEINSILKKIKNTPIMILFNKIDIYKISDNDMSDLNMDKVQISAKNKTGIKTLINKLILNFKNDKDQTLITNARHYSALLKTNKSVSNIKKGLSNNIPGDLLSIDIKEAIENLGEITGEITNDELLGNIFGKFCIGK
jgi:tRNA modification GTPase